MKVGHALRLLPSLEAVFPLRSLLLASAEPDTRDIWGGSSSYRTVGLHEVDSGELRRQFAAGFRTVTAHLDALYTAFADAMDAEDRDDHAGAVRRLLDAGRSEERLGRFDQANAWFRAALQLAEPLQDQHPEIDALLAVGELTEHVGLYQHAARVYQRALALADAAFHAPAAADACVGLGAVATAAGDWRGAQAWYERAMGLAEGAGDASRVAAIHHAIGESMRRRGEAGRAAAELALARDTFETLGQSRDLVRVLCAEARLLADRGARRKAAGLYREALAWLRAGPDDPALDASVRLQMARLLIEDGRHVEAEDELRHAERLAITHHLVHHLVQVYAAMGSVRGQQLDDAGFVFFEQAIQLVPMVGRSPILEAELYYEYGAFMTRVGRPAEARAHLDRARELFESVGASSALRRVETALIQVPA